MKHHLNLIRRPITWGFWISIASASTCLASASTRSTADVPNDGTPDIVDANNTPENTQGITDGSPQVNKLKGNQGTTAGATFNTNDRLFPIPENREPRQPLRQDKRDTPRNEGDNSNNYLFMGGSSAVFLVAMMLLAGNGGKKKNDKKPYYYPTY